MRKNEKGNGGEEIGAKLAEMDRRRRGYGNFQNPKFEIGGFLFGE